MDIRPSQIFFADFFLCHALHHIGTGDKHITGIFHHQDKIGQCRRIDRPTRTRTHDGTDLRDDTGSQRITQEYLRITGQRTDSLLNTGSSRIVQPDDGCSHLHSHIHHFTNLPGIRFGQCTAKNGEVLSKNIHKPFADHTISGYNSITGYFLFLHTEIRTTMGHQFIEFNKRSFLQKQVDTFTCRQFSDRMLFLDTGVSTTFFGLPVQLFQAIDKLFHRLLF